MNLDPYELDPYELYMNYMNYDPCELDLTLVNYSNLF
jgi:hypothetical protein